MWELPNITQFGPSRKAIPTSKSMILKVNLLPDCERMTSCLSKVTYWLMFNFEARGISIKPWAHLHNYLIQQSYIFVQDPERFFAKVKEDTGIDFLGRGDRGGPSGGSGQGGGRGGGGPPGSHQAPPQPTFETYGLNYQFLQQLGITSELTNRVFVANVSVQYYDLTRQAIKLLNSSSCAEFTWPQQLCRRFASEPRFQFYFIT